MKDFLMKKKSPRNYIFEEYKEGEGDREREREQRKHTAKTNLICTGYVRSIRIRICFKNVQ